MNVFLAWSGQASKAMATALRDWLPYVLQNVRPFMSEEDIRKGARWRQEISKQLSTVSFAILCLTRDNLKSPWLHFEAGAIATRAETNQVTALLLGVENQEVVDPLKEFQHTTATKTDLLKLVRDLNELLGEGKVETKRLESTFEKFWGDLELKLREAVKLTDAKVVSKRPAEELLNEILEINRSQNLSMQQIKDALANLSTQPINRSFVTSVNNPMPGMLGNYLGAQVPNFVSAGSAPGFLNLQPAVSTATIPEFLERQFRQFLENESRMKKPVSETANEAAQSPRDDTGEQPLKP
jgi:hypothetical protein